MNSSPSPYASFAFRLIFFCLINVLIRETQIMKVLLIRLCSMYIFFLVFFSNTSQNCHWFPITLRRKPCYCGNCRSNDVF